MVTMAKPLANGYPIGAILLRDAIGSTMTPGMSYYLTACRGACADSAAAALILS